MIPLFRSWKFGKNYLRIFVAKWMSQSIWGLIFTVLLLKLIISKATNPNIVSNCMIKINKWTQNVNHETVSSKPQTLNFQFIFEMLIIFTLNTNEMRVIFVVLISTIFALYPPNMSFLRELFSNFPSSGKYLKHLRPYIYQGSPNEE